MCAAVIVASIGVLAGWLSHHAWVSVIGGLVAVAVLTAGIVRSANAFEDPVERAATVTATELQAVEARLVDLDEMVVELTRRAGLGPMRPARFANFGAFYKPSTHQISVSRAICARVPDKYLRIVLAHEVGHAEHRWSTWFRYGIREELRADLAALRLTGCSLEEWRRAMDLVIDAESIVNTSMIEARYVLLRERVGSQ